MNMYVPYFDPKLPECNTFLWDIFYRMVTVAFLLHTCRYINNMRPSHPLQADQTYPCGWSEILDFEFILIMVVCNHSMSLFYTLILKHCSGYIIIHREKINTWETRATLFFLTHTTPHHWWNDKWRCFNVTQTSSNELSFHCFKYLMEGHAPDIPNPIIPCLKPYSSSLAMHSLLERLLQSIIQQESFH